MKVTLRYGELVHYKEEIEISQEQFDKGIEKAREEFEQYHKEDYSSFEDFLEDINYELVDFLDITPSYDGDFVIDGETQYFEVFVDEDEEEEDYEDDEE